MRHPVKVSSRTGQREKTTAVNLYGDMLLCNVIYEYDMFAKANLICCLWQRLVILIKIILPYAQLVVYIVSAGHITRRAHITLTI